MRSLVVLHEKPMFLLMVIDTLTDVSIVRTDSILMIIVN